jgi:putative ABC transport system permease protein
MAWRDTRSQRARLALYAFSIAIGICALTAIYSLKSTVQEAINLQGKSLLGADLRISSRRPIPEGLLGEMAARVRAESRETSFSSMIGPPSGDRTKLVQIRALEGGYPFGNSIECQPPGSWERLRETSGILVEPSLLAEFGIGVGQTLKVGALELPVLGVVSNGLPRSNRFSGFAPEAFIRLADLPATGLAGEQSLAYHHLAVDWASATEAERTSLSTKAREVLAEKSVQVQTPEDRKESIGEGLERSKEFLGISALAALLLGGIGVAGAIHTHIQKRLPSVAVLLCLGCPSHFAFAIYFVQALAMGLLGAVLGAFAGGLAHGLVVHLASGSLPIAVSLIPPPGILFQTAAAGFAICCAFALMPLIGIQNVSPAATLFQRSGRNPGAYASRAAVCALLASMVWGVTLINGASPARAAAITGFMIFAFSCLAATGTGLMRLTRAVVKPAWPYLARQGISNLFRPHNQTLLVTLSLGLGVFLLLSTWFIRGQVLNQLKLDTSLHTPNVYLIDVQPDQADTVKTLLGRLGLPALEDAPMVTMRIETVKGMKLSPLEAKQTAQAAPPDARRQEVPRWVMEREYRSTYRAHLNGTENVVAGEWPPQSLHSDGAVPISLEQKLAKDLRVGIGDEIVMDVQGVPMRTRVACLRKVDWSRFNLNFFMVFPPGVLEGAPQFHLMTTRVPDAKGSGHLQRALFKEIPNVSAVDLTSLLETISKLLKKASTVIELLSAFTLFAGVPILVAAFLGGREQRVRESVLLRTLGASERQVRTILLVEYTTLGALSATAGGGLAWTAHLAAARWIFKAPAQFETLPFLFAFAGCCLLSMLAGIVIGRGVCSRPPLEVLRQTAS